MFQLLFQLLCSLWIWCNILWWSSSQPTVWGLFESSWHRRMQSIGSVIHFINDTFITILLFNVCCILAPPIFFLGARKSGNLNTCCYQAYYAKQLPMYFKLYLFLYTSIGITGASRGISVTDSQLCTLGVNGADSCQYDSGGGTFLSSPYGYNYLTGIQSYGYGCGTNTPAVNTRITSYIPWILSHSIDRDYCWS